MIAPSVTRVQALTKISRRRLLPHAGEVTVAVGQPVTPVQVVARTSQERGYRIVPAAEILDVSPEDVAKYLLVEEGAAIQAKKPLLRRSGLFGSKSYTSPVNGILYQVYNGRLILQETPELLEVRAQLHGYVSQIVGNLGVVIEAEGTLITAAWGSGREGHGKLSVVVTDADEPLTREHLRGDVRGAILVAGCITHAELVEMAEDNSVRGIIAGSASSALLEQAPELRLPVLITDGFRGRGMAAPIFELLCQAEGREASLFGRDDDPGGDRPEIIIPLPSQHEVRERPTQVQPLQVGQTVRILRGAHAGNVGKICAIYHRSRQAESGLRMPGADVALPGGEVHFVPYPNLDLLL